MGNEHATDWGPIGCVLWLPAGQAGVVSEEGAGHRVVEGPPPSAHGSISAIPEEPSDITYDSLRMHVNTDMPKAAHEASLSCLRCLLYEGKSVTATDISRHAPLGV